MPLEGWKTYIAALLLLVGGAGAYSVGELEKAYELFVLALAVAGIRHAIAKK